MRRAKRIFRISLAAGVLLAIVQPASFRASELISGVARGRVFSADRESAAPSTPMQAALVQATLSDLAWLAGRWQGAWGPRMAEQVWMPPRAGIMEGMFRLVEGEKTLVIELFIVSETPDGIELRIRHFTPSSTAWETSGPAILTLTAIDPQNVVFENRATGDPKKSILKRVDADTYISRAEIVSGNGDTQVNEITYRRLKTPENPSAGNGARR